MNSLLLKEILKFTQNRDWDQFHSPENLAKSIAIEAGELLECYQWDNKANVDHVKEELADVMIYSILMAEKMGFDIDTIISEKLAKNEQKYPVNKSKGNSKKYTEL